MDEFSFFVVFKFLRTWPISFKLLINIHIDVLTFLMSLGVCSDSSLFFLLLVICIFSLFFFVYLIKVYQFH